MSEPEGSIPLEPSSADRPKPHLNVVELAAKRGLGPLSPSGQRVWHGDAKPCVSCGQLVHRTTKACAECGQDLCDEMLDKMRAHSGPWYVHEHVRPFPGVSLERLIRQIRRGVLTRITVVRGPTTYHQWRFAAETPVLSKYLGCCWVCQAAVRATDPVCSSCGVDLDGGFPAGGAPQTEPATPASVEIEKLTSALGSAPDSPRATGESKQIRIGGLPVSWVIALLAVTTMVAVLAVVKLRSAATVANLIVPEVVTTTQPAAPPAPTPTSSPAAGQPDL